MPRYSPGDCCKCGRSLYMGEAHVTWAVDKEGEIRPMISGTCKRCRKKHRLRWRVVRRGSSGSSIYGRKPRTE